MAQGDSRMVVFAPDLQYARRVGGVVEVSGGGARFLTSAAIARRIRDEVARHPGWLTTAELDERGVDPSVRPLLHKLLVPAREASGSRLAALYERIGHELPDLGFVFQNHGYAEDGEDFAWLRPEDRGHRYPLGLARYLVAGLELDGRDVLDVGCGRGGTCSFLARYFAPRRVVGLDFAGSCVALCRRAHPLPRLSFVHGDAAALPFADAAFDVVTNIESSHCYPSTTRFYAEVFRVLRPGAAFCYTDVFGDLAEPARVRDRLQEAGFEIAGEDDITDRVARGLTLGYPDFVRALEAMIAPDRHNAELIASMLDAIARIPREAYAAGRAAYVAWRLIRPGVRAGGEGAA